VKTKPGQMSKKMFDARLGDVVISLLAELMSIAMHSASCAYMPWKNNASILCR
jgi:hypothetical protein